MDTHLARHARDAGRLDLDLDRVAPPSHATATATASSPVAGPAYLLTLSGAVSGLTPAVHEARPPDVHDLETLARWHISWHMGRYWFGPFCFDDLADAVHYARQQHAHAVPEADG